MCELFNKKVATGQFALSSGAGSTIDKDPPDDSCSPGSSSKFPLSPSILSIEEEISDHNSSGPSLPTTMPSRSSSTNHGQKRKHKTGTAQVADAISQLAASTDYSIALQKTRRSRLEEAIQLIEEGGWEEEDLMQAMEIFLNEQKAVIFCTLSPAMRNSWLQRQINMMKEKKDSVLLD